MRNDAANAIATHTHTHARALAHTHAHTALCERVFRRARAFSILVHIPPPVPCRFRRGRARRRLDSVRRRAGDLEVLSLAALRRPPARASGPTPSASILRFFFILCLIFFVSFAARVRPADRVAPCFGGGGGGAAARA